MIAGAVVTHFWVPNVQEKDGKAKLWGGKTKTLEALALGRSGPRSLPVTQRRATEDLGLGWA